jgi:fatty acid desaturase
VTNPYYRKRFAAEDEGHLVIVEALCLAYLVAIAALLASAKITGMHVLKAYLLLCFAFTLNWVRNLGAHRYGNRGERMSHTDQFGDSINITGQTWLTVLMFPVGLRYHALHHLMPMLPYHNLGKAHQRLMTRLPADAPYRAANRNSFFGAAAELWRSALRTSIADSAVDRWRNRSRHA